METKEYAIIAKSFDDVNSLYHDIEHQGCGEHGYCPNRCVQCSLKKPSSRVTYYRLTQEEANLLKQDPRVESVQLSVNELDTKINLSVVQTDIFSKDPSSSYHKNWGLLYCSTDTVPYYWVGARYDITGIRSDVKATINYSDANLGENVDIVILDGGVHYNHPEFAVNADGTGGSRFVQYNWFQHDPVVKGIPATTNYSYIYNTEKNHGTHVAAIAAGNTQGWARKANIYNINIFDNQIPMTLVFDYVKAFHNSKNGSRPTIVNCSFDFSETNALKCFCPGGDLCGLDLDFTPTFLGDIPYEDKEITSIVYQNITYNGNPARNNRFTFGGHEAFSDIQHPTCTSEYWTNNPPCCEDDSAPSDNCTPKYSYGCQCNHSSPTNGTIYLEDCGFYNAEIITDWLYSNRIGYVWSIARCGPLPNPCPFPRASNGEGGYTPNGIDWYYMLQEAPLQLASIDADVADLVSAGAVVVAAAGNNGRHITKPDNINYNNRINRYNADPIYYMRPSTPATNASIVVGALSESQYYYNPLVAIYSNKGPGVDIWAPGSSIMSAIYTKSSEDFNDPRNANFYIGSRSGTSMASPQVAGILACAMSTDNTINASNAKTFLKSQSRLNNIWTNMDRSWDYIWKANPLGEGPFFNRYENLQTSDNHAAKNIHSSVLSSTDIQSTLINGIEVLIYNSNKSFNLNQLSNSIKNKIFKITKVNPSTGLSYQVWCPSQNIIQFSLLNCGDLFTIESKPNTTIFSTVRSLYNSYFLCDNLIRPSSNC